MKPCFHCKHERELREQWERLHHEVHQREQESLSLARQEVNTRLNGMNELRTQIDSERGRYLTRDFYDISIDSRLKVLESTKSNMEGRLWMLGGVISAIVIGVQVLFHFLGNR